MVVIDTNIVVRLLLADDPGQTARARQLLEAEVVFVPLTVVLETEWVLRKAYRLPGPQVLAALRAFAALPQVEVEAPERLARALNLSAGGLDFADALHLTSAAPDPRFATFDSDLVRTASMLGVAGPFAP